MRRMPFVLVAVSLLALVGCASTPASAPAPSFNAQDVMYLQMMIPHHGQGIQIADLAKSRATQPEVKTLAAAISATEATEVDAMKTWLHDWNQPLTGSMSEHGSHMGMTVTDQSAIDALAKTTGADFERRFLNLLSGHQGNAVEMARDEVGSGLSQPVKDLADRIDKSRTAQIKQLLTYVNQLGPQP